MVKISPAEMAIQRENMRAVRLLNEGKHRLCFIRTFGCQQNEADSERLAGMACEMGYTITESPEAADLILVNTCAVREHAELRAMSITGQFKHLKEKNPELVIGICGCMVTQEHRMNAIKHGFDYIDFLLGAGAFYKLPGILLERLTGGKRKFVLDPAEGSLAEGVPVYRKSKIKAWVSVMYGCNNFCTYCVVPYVRGRERSRSPEDILKEVKELVESGCREITLLGQNVNSYGNDADFGCDFADLVKKICSIEGDFILRFMTSHPKDANKKLIDTMADEPKCAKQFHLPLQAGSAKILSDMNRRYTPEEYLELIDYMRSKMPEIAISSDIMVGFPGESEDDFKDTLSMLEKVRFDMIYSFIYSPRELTPAAKMDCQIPEEVKSRRFSRLLETQNKISLEKNQALVGKIKRILIEGESKSSPDMLTGREEGGKLVHVPKSDFANKIGEFVDVKITSAETFALFGEKIQ